MEGPLLFAALLGVAVLLAFIGLWRSIESRDPVEKRLDEYGVTGEIAAERLADGASGRRKWAGVDRLLNGFGVGPRLARSLSQAGLPFTAAEYSLLVMAAGTLGLVLGTVRAGLLLGVVIAGVFALIPLFYLSAAKGRRKRAFTNQLPDVLTLLTGALRAGYGLPQALEMLVDRIPPPAKPEFAWTTRAISLGMPVQQALNEMADRVGSDDLDMVVTAINVQYEMGGDLALTLDIIAETVRERIRIFREIRVLTAQQRLTGYLLAMLPVGLAIFTFVVRPEYIGQLFKPGWVRIIPATAVFLQVLGFLIIRKIVDIEV